MKKSTHIVITALLSIVVGSRWLQGEVFVSCLGGLEFVPQPQQPHAVRVGATVSLTKLQDLSCAVLGTLNTPFSLHDNGILFKVLLNKHLWT